MKIISMVILVFLTLTQLNFSQTTYTWIGGSSTWQNPSNWTPNGVPGNLDNAIINSGTITNDDSVTVAGLSQNGGTITGSGDITIGDAFTFSGGTHTGTGTTTILVGSSAQFTSSTSKNIGRTFIIDGTLEVPGAGGVLFQTGAQIINNGTIDIQTNLTFASVGSIPGTITNNGTFIRSAGTGNATIGASFTNNNSMIIQSGTVNPTGGSNFITALPVTINSGAKMLINGSTHTFNNTTFTGGGTLDFGGGSVNFAGSQVIIDSSITFLHRAGTVTGSADLLIDGSYDFSGGTHTGTGITTIPAGKTAQFTSGTSKNIGRTFIIDGTLEVPGAGGVLFQTGAQIINNGTIDIQTNLTFGSVGSIPGTITNNGTFIRSAGTGNATIAASFTNNNSLFIQTGTLILNNGSSHTSESVNINPGARLYFSGSTHTINNTTFTGGGTLDFGGGSVNFAGSQVIIDSSITFLHRAGTVTGSADLLIDGNYIFSGGTHTGTGITTIPAGKTAQFTSSTSKRIGRTFIIDGTLEVPGSGGVLFETGAQIINNGTFDIQNNLTFGSVGSIPGTITNNGTFIRSAGNGTTTIGARFNNNGILELLSGTLSFNDSLKNNLTGTIKGIGTITPPSSALFVNNGTVSPGLSPGILRFSGNYNQSINAGLDIEIGGFTAGTERDSLAVTGSAALNGNLNVQFMNNFLPDVGDEFFIMSFGSRTGQFSQVNLSNNVSGNVAYLSNGVRLTITSTGLNQSPVAVDDSAVTNKNQPVSVNVLANDFDPDNDPITITGFTQPENGSVTQSGDSTLTYAPDYNFVGLDSLTYTIQDNNGAPATAMVRITVLPFNYPPTAPLLVQPVNHDTLLVQDPINFIWTSSIDPDGDPLTYSLRIFGAGVDTTSAQLSDTTVQFNGSGILQPGSGYQWQVTSSDGNLTAVSDTWNFFMFQSNQPPTAPLLVQPVNNDTLLIQDPINFIWTSSIDPDGDPLTYSLRIFSAGVDTTSAQLSDTTVQFNGSGILQPGSAYQWQVTASDGDLTAVSDTWNFYIQQVPSGLAGIYTIGDGGDFPTINSAVNALTTLGVVGPVTFKIFSGTYDEQVLIGTIPGASVENNIVFESETGNREDVVWGYSQLVNGPENYILSLYLADNVTIRGLTLKALNNNYTRLLLIEVARNLVIENNEFILPKVNTSLTSRQGIVIGSGYDTLKIKGNSIKYGTNGVVIFSWSWGIPLVDISDNTFIDQTNRSISLSALSAVKIIINNNYIDNRNALIRSKGGIRISNSNNLDFEITGNKIFHVPSSSGSSINEGRNSGIHVGLGSNINVINGLIANNFIKLTSSYQNDNFTSGISIGYKQNSGDIKIFHNTIQWVGSNNHITSNCIFLENAINCIVKNNILVNEVNGRSLRVTDTTGNISNYNNLFKIGTGPIVIWGTNFYTDLASYQTATGQDLNSFNIMPSFISPEDVHLNDFVLNNAGTPLAEVTTDIDGEPRDPNTPDIGADEFEPLGFQGVFTVGNSGDFPTITAAVAVLTDTIVTGPVTFNILPGDYDEQVVIGPINGASEDNPIVFQSQTGNRDDVVWGYGQQSSNSNYVIRLSNTAHISIKNLTIEARHQTYGRLIEFHQNPNSNISIFGCRFVGLNVNSTIAALIFNFSSTISNIQIGDNYFVNGFSAFWSNGSSVNLSFSGNKIENPYSRAFYIQDADQLLVNNNIINQTDGNNVFYIVNSNFIFTGNRLYISNNQSGNSGIYSIVIGNSSKGIISNNFIRGKFLSIANFNGGIRTSSLTDSIDIFNNSIWISGPSNNNTPVINKEGSNFVRIINNILFNKAGGPAIISNSSNVESNYNNFLTNGSNLVRWNNVDYPDLSSYQGASGQDLNSISADPLFVADNNLHIRSGSPVENKGTPLAEVTHDIDGQPRSLATPDIGADEFTSTRGITKTRTDLKKPINGQITTKDSIFINPSRESILLSGYAVTDVNILLDKLSHINLADLVITLSFNGITDTLAVNLPDSAAGFIHTLLDDDAEVPLSQGVPPFTGAFKPYKPLSAFNGVDPEGDWILEVYDQSTGTNGILDAWGIEIEFETLTNIQSEPEDIQLPDRYDLAQNYPNPFNPTTTISWQSPVGSHQTLKIYDILGREVATLVDEFREAGRYEVNFDASRLASGVYIYRLSADSPSTGSGQGFVETKKMLLLK
jgi:hypothetical protein